MTKRMYGDLVTALTGGVGNVLFFYEVMLLFNAIQKKEDASMKGLVGPLLIAATQSFKVIFSFWSFLYQSKLASVAAFGFQIYFHFLVGMFGWPAPFAEILLPMFVWQLITVSANTPHPFFVKMAFVFVSTTNMMILSVLSPTESFQANLPVICACTGTFFISFF